MFKWFRLKVQRNKLALDQVPEKTAPLVLTVVDSGDFGFGSCGECGKILSDNSVTHCPFCGTKLVGVTSTPSFGGSDF